MFEGPTSGRLEAEESEDKEEKVDFGHVRTCVGAGQDDEKPNQLSDDDDDEFQVSQHPC